MKSLVFILFAFVGLYISYYFYTNGGDFSNYSVIFGFWTGFFGHIILHWSDKK